MKVIKTDGTETRLMPTDGQFGPVGDKIIGYASFESGAPIVLDVVSLEAGVIHAHQRNRLPCPSYSAAMGGFYCGYRAAYDLMDAVTPLAKIQNMDKILTTEYYLGYSYELIDGAI